MSGAKTLSESQNQPAATPVVFKQPESPEKIAGPQHASPVTTASAARPPNGAPSMMRAAESVGDQRGAGAASRARTMLTLQRSVGNNRVSNLVGTAIQTKLVVGAVDDPHEREADRVAESLPQS